MRTFYFTARCVIAIGFLPAQISAAEFQRLGDLPGGGIYSTPRDITSDGQLIVGISESGQAGAWGQGNEAFIWSPDQGMVGLGFPFSGAPFVGSGAGAVSSDGAVVVVGASRTSPTGELLERGTFLWRREAGFQSIGSPSNAAQFSARAVSGDGHIVVGWTWDGSPLGGNDVFRWTDETGFEILGKLPWSSIDSVTTAEISRDGTTIVGTENGGRFFPNEQYQSFVWRAESGFRPITNPVGSTYFRNFATGVSDDGSIVAGGVDSTVGSSDAFVWTEQVGLTPLKFDHNPRLLVHAYDISGNGKVVVGQMFTNGDFEAVAPMIWDEFRGPRDLQQLLETQLGAADALDGWRLKHAFVVSQDGTVVAGAGTNPHGNFEAWRAVLDPEPAPILLPGDANLDGVVDLLDLERVQANMGIGSFWYQGNFDGVGRVGEADLAIVLANMIPEPSSAALTIAALLFMCVPVQPFKRQLNDRAE